MYGLSLNKLASLSYYTQYNDKYQPAYQMASVKVIYNKGSCEDPIFSSQLPLSVIIP